MAQRQRRGCPPPVLSFWKEARDHLTRAHFHPVGDFAQCSETHRKTCLLLIMFMEPVYSRWCCFLEIMGLCGLFQ